MDENNMMQNFMAAMGVMYVFCLILNREITRWFII